FTILFVRGEKDAAIAAAERSIALNPYDVLAMAEFGGRLIYCGEIDRGVQILNESVNLSPVLPAWSHFPVFVRDYMRAHLTQDNPAQDNLAQARYHASLLTSETYVYGQLARALIAHADGDEIEAQRAVQAILALAPAWGADPRREIGKLINANAIA